MGGAARPPSRRSGGRAVGHLLLQPIGGGAAGATGVGPGAPRACSWQLAPEEERKGIWGLLGKTQVRLWSSLAEQQHLLLLIILL